MSDIIQAWNPYETWDRHHVESVYELKHMYNLFLHDNPVVGGFDTETTGLHIKRDKPFLLVFGWLIPEQDHGRVFTSNITQDSMKVFHFLAKKLKENVAHNTKYDLHMLANAGYPYTYPNLVENMAVARLVVEAIPSRMGGQSLALKSLGENYVHPSANAAEKSIKEIKKEIKAERVKILATALKQFPLPGQYTSTGKQKMWGKAAVEKFLKDIINEPEDLPEEVRELYEDWKSEFENGDYEPTYKDIYERDPEKMRIYAGDDVITMLEFYKKAMPVVAQREQEAVLKRENDLILPLYKMERIGIRIDREYLEQSRLNLKRIIKQKRQRMCEIAGQEFSVGQHDLIKKIFLEKWGIETEKDDKKHLKDIARKNKGTEAEEFTKLIRALRRLEKWYSTYCLRILNISEYDGRYYTQIAQCSAVSGRVGSDGQQFPKERILTEEGEQYEEEKGEGTAPESMEIFFPRRAFIPTDKGKTEGYTGIYYLDFSQIELRNQADYTIRVSGGDLNLCRAYMPFRCRLATNPNTIYDYKDPVKRKLWDLKQPNGDSAWLLEDGTPWTPLDVHSETTHNALMELGYECFEKYKAYGHLPEAPERNAIFGRALDKDGFKMARYKGKIFNFMKNYGGGMRAAMEQLDLPDFAAKALIKGYEIAFPHVVVYQDKVIRKHLVNGYVVNQYQRRYYIDDNNRAYKLANYLIQGTCADMLKECIIKIDKLLESYKTRFIMNIHDELQFEVWAGEEDLIPKILEIMQGHDWHYVPIVSDVEVAYDNWATKKEVA